MRHLDDVPAVAALATAAVGLVDLLSAVTPNVSWRGRELVHLEPVSVMQNAHALAVPASMALIVTAYYLYRRRRGALRLAVGAPARTHRLQRAQGPRLRGGRLTAGCAALLVVSRSSFYGAARAGHAAGRRSCACRCSLARRSRVASPSSPSPRPAASPTAAIVRETGDLLLWQPGPFGVPRRARADGPRRRADLDPGRASRAAWILFRPLAAPRDLPDARAPPRCSADRARARDGHALLLQAPRRQALPLRPPRARPSSGYRVESGVLMVSGDPVGEPAAVAEPHARRWSRFAEERSLRLAALGVSAAGAGALRAGRAAGALPRRRGDRRHATAFSLDGRAHPQGAPVGDAAREGRATAAGSRSSARSTTGVLARARAGRGRAGAAARRSGASAWRWTRSATRTARDTLVVVRASTRTASVGGFLQFVPDLRPRRRLAVVHAPPATTRRTG